MWIIIQLANNHQTLKAILIPKANTILVGAMIMGEIPTVDSLEINPLHTFKSGDWLKVDGTKGTVELIRINR